MNDIENYLCRCVGNIFSPRVYTLILFGSSVFHYGSDLDVCIVMHNYTSNDAHAMATILSDIHKKFGLKLDEDVPFEKKCIFTYDECNFVANNPPFYDGSNKCNIFLDFPKNEEYLLSDHARLRLLFNILTSPTKILSGNMYISPIKYHAWEKLIKLARSFAGSSLTLEEFVKFICINPVTNMTYKDYLGYKYADKRFYYEQLNEFFISL